MRRLEDLKPIAHGEARRHYEYVLRKPAVLGIGNFIENVPGDRHGHHHSLPRTGRELHTVSQECTTVTAELNPLLLGSGSFGEPDQRLDRLRLTKEKPL